MKKLLLIPVFIISFCYAQERPDCIWYDIGQTAGTSWQNNLFEPYTFQPIEFRLEKCDCSPMCGWTVTFTGTVIYQGPQTNVLQFHIANLGTITPPKNYYVVAWMKRQGVGSGTGMIEFKQSGEMYLHNTGTLHAGDTFNFSITYKTE